jgi:hypothetical protein
MQVQLSKKATKQIQKLGLKKQFEKQKALFLRNPFGSLPCLRPAHHIDSKGLRSGIDLCRIPHKMLETPASHKEEPDAWILSVSKPGLNYQNSG